MGFAGCLYVRLHAVDVEHHAVFLEELGYPFSVLVMAGVQRWDVPVAGYDYFYSLPRQSVYGVVEVA